MDQNMIQNGRFEKEEDFFQGKQLKNTTLLQGLFITMIKRITTVLFLAGLCSATSLYSSEASISFAPSSAYSVNGEKVIQAVTGMVCNGESRMRFVKESKALNIPSIRIYLWVNPYNPDWKKQTRQQRIRYMLEHSNEQTIKDAFDRGLTTGPYQGSRKHPSPQYWQLEQMKAWGATKNLTIAFTQFHPESEADFPKYARYFICCIREVKKRFPELQLNRAMIFNEPDYEYPRRFDKNFKSGFNLFVKGYDYVKAAVAAEFPDVSIIGPGTNKSIGNWTVWKNWTIPFIKTAKKIDELNQQNYSSNFNHLLAWSAMEQAAALDIRGHMLPIINTECNVRLRKNAPKWWLDENNIDRIKNESSLLFGMMRNPDIFRVKNYFLYQYKYRLGELIYQLPNKSYKIAAVYYVFRLLNDLRGIRIFAMNNIENNPVECIASNNKGRTVLALFNSGDKEQKIMLNQLNGAKPEQIILEKLVYKPNIKEFVFSSEKVDFIPKHIVMQPLELRKYSADCGAIRKILEEKDIYSKKYALDVNRNICINLKAPLGTKSAIYRLRFAVYAFDKLNTNQIRWKFNGKKMISSFKNKNEELFIEKLFPASAIKKENKLELEAIPGISYRLMFINLSRIPLAKGSPEVQLDKSSEYIDNGYGITINPINGLKPGINIIRYNIKKPTNSKVGWPDFALPPGWEKISQTSDSISVKIPNGEYRGKKTFEAELKDNKEKVLASTKGASRYIVPLHASFGKATEGAPQFIRRHKLLNGEQYISSIVARWDQKNIYLKVSIKGRKLKRVKDMDRFWTSDALEIFLDFFNRKHYIRDDRTAQIVVMPKIGSNKCEIMLYPYHPDMYVLPPEKAVECKAVVSESKDGFSFDISLPWKDITYGRLTPESKRYSPKSGDILGLDLAMGGQLLTDGKSKSHSIPEKWGELILHAKKEQAPNFTFSRSQHTKEIVYLPGKFRIQEWRQGSGKTLFAGRRLSAAQGTLKCKESFSGGKMDIELLISGIEQKKNRRGEIRMYITPDEKNVKGYVEPFTMKNVFWLWAFYSGNDEFKIILLNGKQKLVQTSISNVSFPLLINLNLTRETYSLSTEPQLQNCIQSSGRWIPADKQAWKQPWHMGIKCLKGDKDDGIIIGSIKVE